MLFKTSTAGVHQMQPFCRHSFITIIIIVVIAVVFCHLKFLQPQFLSFLDNGGPTNQQGDGRMDGHVLL